MGWTGARLASLMALLLSQPAPGDGIVTPVPIAALELRIATLEADTLLHGDFKNKRIGIYRAFRKEGIEMAFPQRNIHIRSTTAFTGPKEQTTHDQ